MTSNKNKGKRPFISNTDGRHIKMKFANVGTSKLGGHDSREAQRLKEMYNAMAIKDHAQQPQGVVAEKTSKVKMVQNEEELTNYAHDIMVVKEDLKSIKEAVSSMCDKFATFEASFIILQQHVMKRNPFSSPANERWQSSNSKNNPFVCEICTEIKTANESFSIQSCTHTYCTDCMVKYVASKLEENITSISCPVAECRGMLEPEHCCNILPPDLFDRWGNALCESVILGSQKFYCPFKDCSALLIDDGEEDITESECPNCWRMFCAQCKVPWHAGIECAEFQKLNEDERESEDIMLMKVARNENWKRCPNCRFYVEKKDGCLNMKCRCGTAFCYNCGTPSDKFSDQYHYCRSCNR